MSILRLFPKWATDWRIKAMKLKSKIQIVTGITVFAITLVCNIVVMFFVAQNSIEEAQKKSFQEAVSCFLNIETEINNVGERNNDIVMKYIFKTLADDYLICHTSMPDYDEDEFIYNNTILELANLRDKEYTYGYYDGLNDINMAKLDYGNKNYYMYKTVFEPDYYVYKLIDVTYVGDRLRMIGIALIILTVAITFMSQIIIAAILKKVLKPLDELNETVKNLTLGEYDQRIEVAGNDEIGELGNNFNIMADAIWERTKSLEESERKKTLLIGDLTHELKTPLTSISGYSRTLLTVKLSEEDKEKALSYIYSESCRLERLSKKMLNLVLLEEETEIDLVETEAKELFLRVEESCHKLLEQKEIELVTVVENEKFLVDVDLMTEVLINLIDNAVKASSPKNKIILSASINTIKVQDFGIGIPKEEQDKILEPFYMVDKSRSRKNGGAGLGLAITAMILEKHNCTLAIDSEEGEGTVMNLQFV